MRNLLEIRNFEQAAPFAERVMARGIYDLFVSSARDHGDRVALTMITTGDADEQVSQVTYSELLVQLTQAAGLFKSLAGPAPGVAYMLPNLIETHVTLWGAESVGYAVPVNYLLQPEHIAELVDKSGARILVAFGPDTNLDIWEKALVVKSRLPHIVLLRVGGGDGGDAMTLAMGMARQGAEPYAFGDARTGDDVAAYFHTGGTTGAPKLVAHTHRNQLVAAFGGATLLELSPTDVLTNTLPLFHVGGCIVSSLSVLMSGANVLIMSPVGMRNPSMLKNFWKIVERYRATVIGGVPTALSAVLEVPVDGDLSSVRYGIVGAASAPRSLATRFFQRTGKELHDILGMTEAAGLIAATPAGTLPMPGSVGLRLPYTEVSVRGIEKFDRLCPDYEVGVLAISGPTVSPGYKDEANNAGVFCDGVLNTGDLAFMDSQGRIFLCGRSKDLIIRSGHNVDPEAIEAALCQHPDVMLVAAIGEPDRYAGELPVCYVTLRPGAKATELELQRFAEPLINERPAWPRNVYVMDALPMTGVGKVFKPALRCDATQRVVSRELVHLAGSDGFRIIASAGGKRGMHVDVTLMPEHAALKRPIEQALDGHLFDFNVSVLGS